MVFTDESRVSRRPTRFDASRSTLLFRALSSRRSTRCENTSDASVASRFRRRASNLVRDDAVRPKIMDERRLVKGEPIVRDPKRLPSIDPASDAPLGAE